MTDLTTEQLIRLAMAFRGAYIPASLRETMLELERELLRRGFRI